MMRNLAIAAAIPFVVGCATTESPGVAACQAREHSEAQVSAGTLTVLPSLLAGVRVTQASWSVHASHSDGVTTEYLTLATTLHADRKVEVGELALLYDAPGPHAVVDNALYDEGAQQLSLSVDSVFLDSGAERSSQRMVQVGAHHSLGGASMLDYCPATVRVVPRNALALALMAALSAAGGNGAEANGAPVNTGVLNVLKDTVISDSPGSTLVAGVARNSTESLLTNMVVALVLHSSVEPRIDTLEYFVRAIQPHAVIGFAGGSLKVGERIVGRIAYSASSVVERPIAGELQMHRVSETGWAKRMHANLRVQCAQDPTACAR